MKIKFIALCTAAAFSTAAGAGTGVDYDTLGSTLSCNGIVGCNPSSTATSSSVTINGVELTFTDVNTGGFVDTGGGTSNLGYGNFEATGAGGGESFSGVQFTLKVTDEDSGGGSVSFPSINFNGSLSPGNSSAFVLFPSESESVGGFTFSLNNKSDIFMSPPNQGADTLLGTVSGASAVPLPASAWLLLSALGLGAMTLRRKGRALALPGSLAA